MRVLLFVRPSRRQNASFEVAGQTTRKLLELIDSSLTLHVKKRSKIDNPTTRKFNSLSNQLSNLPTQQLCSHLTNHLFGTTTVTIGPEVRTPTYAIQGCIQLFIPLLQLCRGRQALPEGWIVAGFLVCLDAQVVPRPTPTGVICSTSKTAKTLGAYRKRMR